MGYSSWGHKESEMTEHLCVTHAHRLVESQDAELGMGGLVVKLYSDFPLYLDWQTENEIEYEVENNTKNIPDMIAKKFQFFVFFKVITPNLYNLCIY